MRKTIFMATLCIFMLLSAQAFAAGFSDTKGHWAIQEIDECAAVGTINGYPGNVFKPDNSVSHLEALVMIIKSMGLEQQAKDLNLTAGNYNFPAGMTWGKEFVALSADKGIINKQNMNYLTPNDPTTRAEAAVLIVNALHLTADGYQLSFADNAQIQGTDKESIAAAVKNGVMVGLPGNKFEPARKVTRAEMVTIVSRLFNKGLTNPYPSRYFISQIDGINATNQLVALKKYASPAQPYSLAADCLIYKAGKKTSLNNFLESDIVKVVLDNSKRVKYLAQLSSSDMLPDQNPNTGNTTGRVNGEVVDCRNNSITIIEDNDVVKTYEIGANVTVTNSDDVALSMNELDNGDEVELQLSQNKVVAITVDKDKESTTVNGRVITSKTSGDYAITILEDEDEEDIKYDVIDDVVVKDGSKTLDFDEIEEGYEVELYLDSDEDVFKIEITSDDRIITGEVTDLDDRGDYGITIEKLDGKSAEYAVDEDVDVEEGSRSRDFEDIEEGDEVELILDEDDLVTDIEITDGRSGSEEGIITALDLDDDEMTLENDDDETDYELDRGVEVVKDGDDLELEDLIIGSEVELELDDDLVVVIEITDDEDIEVEGEIVRVYSDAIKIEQKSDSEFRFDFDNDPTLEDEDGDDIDIDDLDVGQDVRLQLRDGEIHKLEII